MNAVERRAQRVAAFDGRKLPHIIRWKAMSRLRDCLTPIIHAAWDHDDVEIARLRQAIVDYSYIAQYESDER